jgi:predicted phage terminase large subunit-like protein
MFHVNKITVGKPNRIMRRIRYWDKAASQGSGAFTVGVLMGIDTENRYWILDVVRGQWDSGRREMIMRQTAMKDGLKTIIWLEQEPGGGGKDSAMGSVRGLAGFRVRPDKVGKSDGDKENRADAFSTQVNIGNVSMVEATWNRDYIEELRYFPRSRYKDQVDASSGAFNKLAMARIVLGGMNTIINQQMSSQRDERLDPEKGKARSRGRVARATVSY